MIPVLLKRLGTESDPGLRLAYSSALGKLRAAEAVPMLMRYLWMAGAGDEMPRREFALAVARIIGAEDRFIGLLRSAEVDPGTSTSRALVAVAREFADGDQKSKALLNAIDRCEDALAREDLQLGAESLAEVLQLAPKRQMGEPISSIVGECAERLHEFGGERIEYVVLAINALQAASDQPPSYQESSTSSP